MVVQYSIKDTDGFDGHLFPAITTEMDVLQASLREIERAQKGRIIISMLRDHSIWTEWLDGNKQLTGLLTSGFLPTSHVESLFSSCKHNANFMSGLEAYITSRLA